METPEELAKRKAELPVKIGRSQRKYKDKNGNLVESTVKDYPEEPCY